MQEGSGAGSLQNSEVCSKIVDCNLKLHFKRGEMKETKDRNARRHKGLEKSKVRTSASPSADTFSAETCATTHKQVSMTGQVVRTEAVPGCGLR